MNFLTLEEKKIINHLYINGADYSRNMSKKLFLPPITISRILRRLEKNGIFKKQVKGNIKEFSLNYQSFNAIGMLSMIEDERLSILKEQAIVKTILQNCPASFFIIIYGSVLRIPTPESDVDILFISNKKNEIIKFCRETSILTGKDISPHILTFIEFKKMIISKEAFVANAILIPKNRIFLLGIDSFLKMFSQYF